MRVLVIVGLLALVAVSEGKIFTRGALVRELRNHFPMNQIPDWVCLIEAESSRNTAAIGKDNDDGSMDHGLFQINDRYWCNNGNTPGKTCGVTCAQLRTDDIKAAVRCAKIIYGEHGFNAWVGWVKKCKGKPLPDVREF